MTKRRRNYLDWRNTRDIHRKELLEDKDGPLDDFSNNRTAEDKPYVSTTQGLRFKLQGLRLKLQI